MTKQEKTSASKDKQKQASDKPTPGKEGGKQDTGKRTSGNKN